MTSAKDNISVAKKVMKAKAVYWELDGVDNFGQPLVSPPIEILCRWDDVVEEVITDDGTRMTARARVMVDRDLKVKSLLTRGSLEELVDTTNPRANPNTWEIRRFDKIADVKGKKYLREVYL